MKSSSQLHQHQQHPYQQSQAQSQSQHHPHHYNQKQQQQHHHHQQLQLQQQKQQQQHHHQQQQQLREPPSYINGLASCSGDSMSERLGLGPDVRTLKLGPTFLSDRPSTAFHTIKYDFKPASVDTSKMATVDVGNNNTMTVTVPHLDGAGVPQTVFKGSQRPYTKECVLIIDNVTGEITLERLSCNIQVKKTRSQTKTQSLLSVNSHSGIRPVTPIDTRKSPTHGRTKSRTKVASGKKREPSHQLHPKQSPQCASYHGKSPPMKSPSSSSSSNVNINSSAMPSSSQSLASLPIIGENDDFPLSFPVPMSVPVHTPVVTVTAAAPAAASSSSTSSSASASTTSHSTAPPRTRSPAVREKPPIKAPILDNEGDNLSDSSSSDSSSDSSDSESEAEKSSTKKINGHAANGTKTSPPLSMPDVLLSEDLQLSESESDSD